jgi:hypothetical protein
MKPANAAPSSHILVSFARRTQGCVLRNVRESVQATVLTRSRDQSRCELKTAQLLRGNSLGALSYTQFTDTCGHQRIVV